MIFMQEFRVKRLMGMYYDVTVLKLKSNESHLVKKKLHFSITFFLIDVEAGASVIFSFLG